MPWMQNPAMPYPRMQRPLNARNQANALLRNKIVCSLQTNATRRLQKDYKALQEADIPLVGVSAKPTDANMHIWHANVRAPETSAYYGGVFHFEIQFP